MKSQKLSVSWILVVAPMSLFSGFALADGGGIHGPDLSPVSITLGDPNGVREDFARASYEVCMLTGSAEDGKEGMLQKIMKQVFPGVSFQKSGNLFEWLERYGVHSINSTLSPDMSFTPLETGAWWGSTFRDWGGVGRTRYFEPTLGYLRAVSRTLQSNGWYLTIDHTAVYRNTGEIELSRDMYYQGIDKDKIVITGKKLHTEITLRLPKSNTLPGIMGSSKEIVNPGVSQPPYFQPVGRKTAKVLTDARIEWQGDLAAVNLVSAYDELERPTPAIADLPAYVDCLKGEYQKAVVKGPDWQ